MSTRSERALTTPDLVLLSLLAERPMHGYEANAELERRHVRDWAGISRPQVYYSLEKLAARQLVREVASRDPAAGPDRRVLATTKAGLDALADALSAPEWATDRDRPAFLTWMALSWKARPTAFDAQLRRRREFLDAEAAHARVTLRDVLAEVGHPHHEAVWMLKLTIAKIDAERRWLGTVAREASRRRAARAGRQRLIELSKAETSRADGPK